MVMAKARPHIPCTIRTVGDVTIITGRGGTSFFRKGMPIATALRDEQGALRLTVVGQDPVLETFSSSVDDAVAAILLLVGAESAISPPVG